MKVYLFCTFHLGRLLRQYPLASAALLSGAASAVGGLVLLLYWAGQHRDLAEALDGARRTPPPKAAIAGAAASLHPQLPAFSSAEFAAQLAEVVKEIGLSSDEVAYALDSDEGQPYWRYRVRLQVQSGYPTIRRFLAAISSDFPNVALDSIQCQRENSATAGLRCELALSAFFGKPAKRG